MENDFSPEDVQRRMTRGDDVRHIADLIKEKALPGDLKWFLMDVWAEVMRTVDKQEAAAKKTSKKLNRSAAETDPRSGAKPRMPVRVIAAVRALKRASSEAVTAEVSRDGHGEADPTNINTTLARLWNGGNGDLEREKPKGGGPYVYWLKGRR